MQLAHTVCIFECIDCLWKNTQERDNRVVSGQGSEGLRALRSEETLLFTIFLFFKIFTSCMH